MQLIDMKRKRVFGFSMVTLVVVYLVADFAKVVPADFSVLKMAGIRKE